MSTSLLEQLKELRVPQTLQLSLSKKRASLLFDPKEAANLTRRTVYEIGRNGFDELLKVNDKFEEFNSNLFHSSSINVERSMLSAEENDKLDKTIRKFLLTLSPYFMLKSSHKALEWLINRFHINEYNQDDIFMLILPYHETNIFVRFLQILRVKGSTNKWNWLYHLQKPGIVLAKSILINHCASDVSFLQFVCKMTLATSKVYNDEAKLLKVLYAFYCMTVLGALNISKTVTEQQVNQLLPSVLKGLSSEFEDFKASACMITAQMIVKTKLSIKVLEKLVHKIVSNSEVLNTEGIMLLVLIYQSHLPDFNTVPLKTLNKIIEMDDFPDTLVKVAMTKARIAPFLLTLFSELLNMIQECEEIESAKKFVENLLTEIQLDKHTACLLIRLSIENYKIGIENNLNESNDDSTEIVQICLDDEDIRIWYSHFMKRLETKYPETFDEVISQVMKSDDFNNHQKATIRVLLNFVPSVIYKTGDTDLFQKLYHPNDHIRAEAVKFIIENPNSLKGKNFEYLKESFLDRLNDDSPIVVEQFFQRNVHIFDLFDQEELVHTLINLLKKCFNKKSEWEGLMGKLLLLFSNRAPFNAKNFSIIFPFIMSGDANIVVGIVKSKFGNNSLIFGKLRKILKDLTVNKKNNSIGAAFCESIFSKDCLSEVNNLVDSLDSIPDADKDTLYKYFGIVLSIASLSARNSPERNLTIFNRVVHYIETSCVYLVENIPAPDVNQCIDLICACVPSVFQEKIPLQIFLYFINSLIEHTHIQNRDSQWLDLVNPNSSTKFLVRVYEILLFGCCLDDSKMKSLYSRRLNLFLTRFFPTFRLRIEFLSNLITFPNLKNSSDNEQRFTLNPELLLCTIRIINSLLNQSNEPWSWILDFQSNCCIPILLISLTNPMAAIRKAVMSIIETVIGLITSRLKYNFYFHLLEAVVKRKHEILLDSEQLPLILFLLISKKSLGSPKGSPKIKQNANHIRMALNNMIDLVCDDSVPLHIKAALLNILAQINSSEILIKMSTIALGLLERSSKMTANSCMTLYESKILCNIFNRINISTLQGINGTSMIWKMIKSGCKQHRVFILSENLVYVCPAVVLFQAIDKPIFEIFPDNLQTEFIEILIEISTDSENSDITSSAFKLIKRIELNCKSLLNVLDKMTKVKDLSEQISGTKRRSRRISAPSLKTVDTSEWKYGITALEFIQNKKKLRNINAILPVLFSILKKCLEFEEQEVLEYAKQLVLSCILNCCEKLSLTGDKWEDVDKISNAFNIELVVQCIQMTHNPQTHHHALLVLAQAASIIPDQVLHHIMAIFTFMGSSVLRHDDAYSFQIISRIIDTIIPVLLDVNKDDDQDEEENVDRVAPILRVFVDVLLHVPVHRRLPLFKKLLEKLDARNYLWVFLALVFESHIVHGNEKQPTDNELPARLEVAKNLCCLFTPSIVLHSCVKLVHYLRELPAEKQERDVSMEVDGAKKSLLFDIQQHTPKQFKHYKYTMLTFLSKLLSNPQFVRFVALLNDEETMQMEPFYKSMIINTLSYIQSVSKCADQYSDKPQGKYWKVMLHHVYDLLDSVNLLLSNEMFLLVIRGLMTHNIPSVRRKAMELLNTRLQRHDDFFKEMNVENLYALIQPLVDVIETIKDEDTEIENELNQQTALISIKLLAKLLASDYPDKFKPILETVTSVMKLKKKTDGNVLASLMLCLAELCSSLKVHSLYYYGGFMPVLLKILTTQRNKDTPDVTVLSAVTTILKIVETLPHFLKQYLEKLLFETSLMCEKWEHDAENQKVAPVMQKLKCIRQKIALLVPLRILISSIGRCYEKLLSEEKYEAIGSLMNLLAESIKNIQNVDLKSSLSDLTSFFLTALQFRADYSDKNVSQQQISVVEEHIVAALIALVLKLSESSFRPLYYKLFDWAARNVTQKDRAITFYKVSSGIAEALKGLFVLFAAHFINHSANLLDSCNKIKSESLYFESEEKCIYLVEYIVQTLNSVFLYETRNFINRERFDTLLMPIVDQLENTLGGISMLKERAENFLIPCITHFAVATADDALWKQLNYQILLKTRHNEPDIRLLSLNCLCEVAKKLGEDFLPLLPEVIPFLAELLEDDVDAISKYCQKVVQELEKVLGEPLQKYF